jgi:flagellar basal-body rod protein FlgG
MLRGLYISGIGMRSQMDRMSVISNNLANVDTTGFKRDVTASRSFTDEVMNRLHAEVPDPITGHARHHVPINRFTSGVFVDEVHTDFMQGALQAAGDQYALAIAGNGFFAVSVPLANGEMVTRYTRDGSFTPDSQGMLMTRDGGIVLSDANTPIFIPQGFSEIIIDNTGRIIAGGDVVAALQMVDFENYASLRKMGNNYFDVTEQTVQIPFTGRVEQGYLELSNINAVREMIDIINVSRIYEANARFVQAMDETLGRAVSQIAAK